MRNLLLATAVIFAWHIVRAQAPQLLNYQAVVRNAQGQALATATVNFQFQIHDGTQGGNVVFTETDTATTNQFGLATVQIGISTPLSGVNWGSGNKYLQVGVDITGGTNFAGMGTSQLLSVPYALYSGGGNTWGLSGNTGTTYGTNFIGTIDSVNLMFRVKDSVAGRIETYPTANTSLGQSTLRVNSGTWNSGFGAGVLSRNTTGSYNAAIGEGALTFNTTGNNNTAVGEGALNSNVSGASNTAVGHLSLLKDTVGANNSAVGAEALYSNTTGYSNVAVGFRAMYNNTTTSNQVAIGDSALYSNVTGTNNTATGHLAMNANTTGSDNVAFGESALMSNVSSIENAAFGCRALVLTTGADNTGLGHQAGLSVTSGGANVAVGANAMWITTTGSGNTGIGDLALAHNTTGSSNTAIGNQADVTLGALSNATALGYDAKVDSSNKVFIGNTSVVSIGGQVHWTTFSDERVKTNVAQNVPGLSFINLLQPVTYHYDINKENELLGVKDNTAEWPGKRDIENIAFSGFIAQQVDMAAKNAGYNFSGVDKHGSIWGLRYSEFVPSIVKSVQELDSKLDNKIAEQQQMIDELRKEVEELKKK